MRISWLIVAVCSLAKSSLLRRNVKRALHGPLDLRLGGNLHSQHFDWGGGVGLLQGLVGVEEFGRDVADWEFEG